MYTRVLRTAAAVLSHTFEVGEEPTDADGTVTVTVTDANGEQVTTGDAGHGDTGVYTFALDGQAAVALLDVAWSATVSGAAVVEHDTVEIVGGFFFTLRQGRNSDPVLADTDRYPGEQLVDKRLQVEAECEAICDRAFVPRYARVVLDGTGSPELVLAHPDPDRSVADVRRVRSVSMAQRADQTFTDFTTAELAAVRVGADGTLRRLDGQAFYEGYSNVIVEYEYGLDTPPADLVQAALTRLRIRLNVANSAVPDRAASFTSVEGGTYRLTMPDSYQTGVPDVDAVYGRYSRRSGAGTGRDGRQIAASRTLSYDPQYTSLFHLGRR